MTFSHPEAETGCTIVVCRHRNQEIGLYSKLRKRASYNSCLRAMVYQNKKDKVMQRRQVLIRSRRRRPSGYSPSLEYLRASARNTS
jgi:hypothetical protein